MRIIVYMSLEFLAVLLNIAFTIVVWSRGSVGVFLRCVLMGLVFVNLLTNLQCMALDLSMVAGVYLGWPICFTQFLNAPFCVYGTLMLVTVINIERVVAVNWPLIYAANFTRRNGALTVLVLLTFAMGLSFLGLPDILYRYEISAGICLPSDLYPKRYATLLICAICTFLLIVVVTSFLLNVHALVKFTRPKIVLTERVSTPRLSKMTRKALVASRIAIVSAFLYSWTVGFMVSFLFWVNLTGCDDLCLAEGNYGYAAAIVQLFLTVQDPLIFFISITKWPSRCCAFCWLPKLNSNQVTPMDTDQQSSW